MKNKKFTEFKEYLVEFGHTSQTVKSYLHVLKTFSSDNPNASKMTYRELVYYFKLKAEDNTPVHRRPVFIAGIKKYYNFLIETGKRSDHPCRNFQIRCNYKKSIIRQDLFSSKELEMLFNRKERYEFLRNRNAVILSLLIYQGLYSGEIAALNLSHVNLETGKIYIKASSHVSRRHLELTHIQQQLFENYITECRPRLLKSDNDAFILGKLGERVKVEDIHYLVSTFKGLFPDRNITPLTIRKSVVAIWLNEMKIPLEQVQMLSGQKWLSTTKRYKFVDPEEELRIINSVHPLRFKENN